MLDRVAAELANLKKEAAVADELMQELNQQLEGSVPFVLYADAIDQLKAVTLERDALLLQIADLIELYEINTAS